MPLVTLPPRQKADDTETSAVHIAVMMMCYDEYLARRLLQCKSKSDISDLMDEIFDIDTAYWTISETPSRLEKHIETMQVPS